jgi:hypothetical protein
MTALWLFIISAGRGLRQAPLARRPQAATTPPARGEGKDARGASEPEPAATSWDVVKYAIDSTARTVRLCVIITVTMLAVLLVIRLGNRLDIEFLFK